MKTRFIATLSALVASAALSQEAVPQAEAMKAAAMCYAASADITDAGITIDSDIKNPFAMKGGGEIGMMVIPETKLAKEIALAGEGITPVGQIWMKGLLPILGGSTITRDKLRTVTVADGSSSFLLPVFFVGMQSGAGGAKELVIYSQDKTPLTTLPLKSIEQEQKLPVEFSVVKAGDHTADVRLNIIGKFQASFAITEDK
jgi:hypothetical protein